jgi:hypothetical protein
MRYWLIVSAVPPDLETTLKSVFRSSTRSRNAPMVAGSTLSSTYSRG